MSIGHAYCLVTCSCMSIHTYHKYICIHNVHHIHLWGCICTWEHKVIFTFVLFINMQCMINDDQNPPNLWSYNSSCAAVNPHAFALARLLSMLYTERYIVKCVSFMLANTPIAMCTQYTANETHFTKECHKHKTDTVLIYIQCTSQNVWLTIVINMSDTVVPRVEQIENLRWAWGQSFSPGSRSCWWLVRTRGGGSCSPVFAVQQNAHRCAHLLCWSHCSHVVHRWDAFALPVCSHFSAVHIWPLGISAVWDETPNPPDFNFSPLW